MSQVCLIVLATLTCVACSSSTPATSPIAPSAVSLREKAVHAIIHGRHADARRFATEALAARGGAEEVQAHLVLAVLDYQDCAVDSAAGHIAASSGVAPDDFPLADRLEAARVGLKRFGRVDLVPAGDRPATGPTFIRIAPTSPPLDPETRQCLEAIDRRLKDPIPLPKTVSVPAGEYRVGDGPPFVVGPGQVVRVISPEGRVMY